MDKDFKVISRVTRGYEVVVADVAESSDEISLSSRLNR
ncbi:hypothetical protein DFH84_003538 [Clostridium saccharobutylicum]|uniref:Uncharacterized protein n=1 Tax=Clostridium saccharobutylicum DSM 13864 TaxID=1345695 RepID=U5MMN1_CLOSA|nr:hypothetical protein CLSA_c08370 [Clostridium saccharobutylicum DSM 13864]MBA2903866.1 hypothetical protein [Clostridium saccharobutylicum]NOV56631.1 hypothetical protein [Clostridium saccharobutylicum]NOW11649.1 hypothetical protein [Clostridium saccharobutylicum]NOW17069.1 hypothetical protein [Clostridium saccharobutylicum]